MEFDYDLLLAIDEAHSLMLSYRHHDGSAHCECRIAQWLRDFNERYSDSIRREARRRKSAAARKRNREVYE